jgi:hypothetical protein
MAFVMKTWTTLDWQRKQGMANANNKQERSDKGGQPRERERKNAHEKTTQTNTRAFACAFGAGAGA